jgi:hypothetical protein
MGLPGLKNFVFIPSRQKARRYPVSWTSRITLFTGVWPGAMKYPENQRENPYAGYNERSVSTGDRWHDLVAAAMAAFMSSANSDGLAAACVGIGNGWKQN